MNNYGYFKSIAGSAGTYILGKVTLSTGSSLTAGLQVLLGTATLIYTVMKIVQWVDWWKHRKDPSQKPPSI